MRTKLIMTLLGLVIPAFMMISGFLLIRNTPKKKAKIAYRTKWSQKSKETWKYAHDILGRIWLGMGSVFAIASIGILMIAQVGTEASVTAIASTLETTQFTLLLLTVVPVEVALRHNFNKYGERKLRRKRG